MSCSNIFWTRDIPQLWCDWTLVPSQDEGLYIQLNTLSRLVICVSLVVYLVRRRVDESVVILFLGLGTMALLALTMPVPESG